MSSCLQWCHPVYSEHCCNIFKAISSWNSAAGQVHNKQVCLLKQLESQYASQQDLREKGTFSTLDKMQLRQPQHGWSFSRRHYLSLALCNLRRPILLDYTTLLDWQQPYLLCADSGSKEESQAHSLWLKEESQAHSLWQPPRPSQNFQVTCYRNKWANNGFDSDSLTLMSQA